MPSKFSDPQNQFLLNTGLGMMGQPYTRAPQNAFSGMQKAFSQGTSAYNNAMIFQQQQDDREAQQMQLAQAERAKKEQHEAFKRMVQGMPNAPTLIQMHKVDAAKALETFYSQRNPDPAEIDTSNYINDASFAMFGKTPSQITDPQQREAVSARARELRLLENPQTVPNPWDTASATRGMDYAKIVDTETAGAIEKMGTLRVMEQLNETILSGSIAAPGYTKLQGLMKDFLNVDISIDDPSAAKEAYDALAVELMRQERKHGPRDARFTDKDAEFYITSVSSTKNTPAGRRLILGVVMSREQAKLDRQDFMNQKEQEYLAKGMTSGQALQRATNDTKMYDLDKARDKKGMFVNEVTGQLTILGQRIAEATGQIPVPENSKPVKGPNGEPGRELSDGTIVVFNPQTGQWERQ